jgi:hypothetical protein
LNPRTLASHPAFAILIILGCIFFVAGASWHTWPADIFNYDLIHDLLSARRLAESGVLPVHGSISSFGVFNPPGVAFGLLPGYLLFPTESVLGMRVMTILFSVLSICGIFLLLYKRFGCGVALSACLFYLLSSTGWYFMAEMRPRAHPVFVIWIIFFLDKWISEHKAWAAFPVVFLQAAALYWMLEIAPLLLTIIVSVVVFRPPVRWSWIIAGAALSLVLWFPYLNFEYKRDFQDLRVLLIEQKPAHNMAKLFNGQLRDSGLKRTMGFRCHTIPGYSPVGDDSPEKNISTEENVSVPTSFAHRFYQTISLLVPQFYLPWTAPVFLIFILAGCILLRNRAGDERETEAAKLHHRTHGILVITAVLCGGTLFLLTFGEAENVIIRRFLWLWIVFAILVVLGVRQFFRLLIGNKRIAILISTATLALLLIDLALNPTMIAKGSSWILHGPGTVPPGEFSEVIDDVAQTIKENGLPPVIGYDIPFLAWVPAVGELDGISSIGIQYDLMLSFRHGIQNLNTDPLSVSPGDSIRIVEYSSEQKWRQSYLDLTGFPPMDVLKELDSYAILIKPSDHADQDP